MKVQFSKEVAYEPEFNGNKELPEAERLQAKVKPMTVLEVIDLTDALRTVGFQAGDVKDLTPDQMRAVVAQAGHYVPKYCSLTGNDGFSVEDVVNYTPFLSLASELLFVLLNTSSPSQADVKNS